MLDNKNFRFIYSGGSIELSPAETKIMEFLISRKTIFTNANLIGRKVFGTSNEATKRKVLNIIAKINQKLKGICRITSKINIGYRVKYLLDK
jgi:DNA-binding response OmpR family regulator